MNQRKLTAPSIFPTENVAPDTWERSVLSLLESCDGGDSRRYRADLVRRRVLRRMGFHYIDALDDYVAMLRSDGGELAALRRDVVDGVASLSLRAAAARVLSEHVVPELLRSACRGERARAWICRCGTGEAAYALAMLLRSQLEAAGCQDALQVFATDIDEQSLTLARRGIFPVTVTRELPRGMLERYFDRHDKTHYRVTDDLRDTIVFAAHDWLHDPPFTRLDLIVSAGALARLTKDGQTALLERFHYALRDQRFLMLTSAESLEAVPPAMFAPLRRRLRLYRRLTPPPGQRQLPLALLRSHPADAGDVLNRVLLEQAPPAVLVDGDFSILAAHGSIASYLRPPFVQRRANLLALLSGEHGAKLRAAAEELCRTGSANAAVDTRVSSAPQSQAGSLRVRRVAAPGAQHEGLLVVSFHDAAALALERGEKPSNELTSTVASEFQRVREDLEVSREELASLNEEHVSVTRELVEKVAELNRANADLASLLESTESVLFLDADLKITRCAPGAASLLHVRPGDVGRPISDLASEFRDNSLIEDCRLALERFEPVERPVETFDGRWFSRRVLPYRGPADPEIVGVLVAFTDISESLRARRAVLETEYWRRLVDHLPVGAVLIAEDRVYINEAVVRLTGYGREEALTPRQWFAYIFGPRADEMYALYEAQRRRGFTEPAVFTFRRKDGAERTLESWGAEYEGGEIHVLHDVTEKHALQRQVLELVGKEQRTVGQELHDTVLQDLSALGLLAASLAERLPPKGAERERATRLATGLGALNVAVQRVAEGLLPLPMEDADLGAALDALAARVTANHGIGCRLDKAGHVELDAQTAHELYRIAQEALTNVVKHAAAKTAEIVLAQDAEATTLEIVDDGIGIDASRRGAGLGTRIMQYRCQLIGGRFVLAGTAGGGTRVTCTVPRLGDREAA
jgi:two-component system CheB/CheR fusion protein